MSDEGQGVVTLAGSFFPVRRGQSYPDLQAPRVECFEEDVMG